MIRAVVDTNVLASGIAGVSDATSTPGEVFRRWRRRSYRLVISVHVLDELKSTLAKPYFANRMAQTRSRERCGLSESEENGRR